MDFSLATNWRGKRFQPRMRVAIFEATREKWRSEPVRERRIRAVRLDSEDIDDDDMVNGFVDLTVEDGPVKKKQRK